MDRVVGFSFEIGIFRLSWVQEPQAIVHAEARRAQADLGISARGIVVVDPGDTTIKTVTVELSLMFPPVNRNSSVGSVSLASQ